MEMIECHAAPFDASDGPVNEALARLRARASDLRAVKATGEVLYWDDRLVRPRAPAAGRWRARQRALHAEHFHRLATSPALQREIADVEDADPGNIEAAAMRRAMEIQSAVPRELWAAREAAASETRAAWEQARAERSAQAYLPALEVMLGAIQRQAEHVGYEGEPYEACLREWEPGIDLPTLDRCFEQLEEGLAPLRRESCAVDPQLVCRPFSAEAMDCVERESLTAVGWDSARGLLVASDRAFCLPLGPDDVRLASRFGASPGIQGIHSTLHEAGHGIYAQSFSRLGVPATLAAPPGLGLDESQSRILENAVGRSQPFLRWLFGVLRGHAPDVFAAGASFEQLRRELTSAEHPCRRLGCDEASYDLHVLLRTRLERALVNGEMRVSELPDAWDALSQELLGVRPDDDLDGCLQDIHWALGQWGYFPTYTLGNVYGAQLLERAAADLGDLDDELEQAGDTSRLRAWMDHHVYRFGCSIEGRALVEDVSGRALDASSLVRAVTERAVSRPA